MMLKRKNTSSRKNNDTSDLSQIEWHGHPTPPQMSVVQDSPHSRCWRKNHRPPISRNWILCVMAREQKWSPYSTWSTAKPGLGAIRWLSDPRHRKMVSMSMSCLFVSVLFGAGSDFSIPEANWCSTRHFTEKSLEFEWDVHARFLIKCPTWLNPSNEATNLRQQHKCGK